jgi:hypothetical protein
MRPQKSFAGNAGEGRVLYFLVVLRFVLTELRRLTDLLRDDDLGLDLHGQHFDLDRDFIFVNGLCT